MCLNCVVSTYIGCLFCRKGCDAEKVRSGFTFVPPRPSYRVEADPEDAERCRRRLRYRYPALSNNSDYREAAEVSEVIELTTRTGSRIPIVWLRRGGVGQAPRPQPLAACQEGSSQAPAAPTAASTWEASGEPWPRSAREPPEASTSEASGEPWPSAHEPAEASAASADSAAPPTALAAEAPEARDDGFVTPEEGEDGQEPEEYLTPRGGYRSEPPPGPPASAPPPEPAPAPIPEAADEQAEPEPLEEPPLVLLHCHGNATDIGLMMGPYYDMVRKLGIEVVGVEYSGYGDASGKPGSGNCLGDIEAAYKYLTGEGGVAPSRIVAYGQSVGSGPAAHLAALAGGGLGGVVLHSPLLSGIKVVDPMPDSCCRPSCVWRCFDFYQNDRRARQFECPAFIMHGRHDEIIPFYHAHRLHQACPERTRWPAYFPNGAGHNDLVEWDVRTYYAEFQGFLDEVRRIASGEEPSCPAARARRPRQVEGRPRAEVLSTVGSARPTPTAGTVTVDDFIGGARVAEPQVGPEDGRYEKMRHGAGWMPNAV